MGMAIEKQTFTYKVGNGFTLQADVYACQPLTPRPVLLWIHGGCLMYGERGQLRSYQLESYLQAGFTVVAIDYRLAPESKLELILEDLRDAYAWCLTEGPRLFGLDGERVVVVGHSAGGYLTLMAGFCVQPRPKALVSFYGYGDIIGEWYSRPDPFYCEQPAVSEEEARRNRDLFYLYCRQTGRWPLEVAGHDPDREPQWFVPFCPLQNVTNEYPPTLLIHGVLDTDVPYAQSHLMAQALAAHKVEYELLTLPTAGHGFDRKDDDPQVAEVFSRVIEFLRTHS